MSSSRSWASSLLLGLALVPGLSAQSLSPDTRRPEPVSFSFSTWNPWAVRYQPRLIPEPVRALAPRTVLPRWNPAVADHASLSLGDLRGEIVVLDFWARSCPPCIPLHDALVRMAPTWEAQGVRVLSILSAEDPKGLEQFFEAHGGPPPFPVLIDRSGSALSAFEHTGIPTVIVLDHHGRVAFDRLGGSKKITDLPQLFPTLLAARDR